MALYLYKWKGSDNDFIAVGQDSVTAECYIVQSNYRFLHPPTLGQMLKFNAVDPDTFEGPIETTHQEVLELYGPVLSRTQSTEDIHKIIVFAEEEHNENKIYNVYKRYRAKSGYHVVGISTRRKAKEKDLVRVVNINQNEKNSYEGVLKTFVKSVKSKNNIKTDLWEVKPLDRQELRKSKE